MKDRFPLRDQVLDKLREIAGSRTGTFSDINRIDLAKEIGCSESDLRTAVYHLTAAGALRLIKKSLKTGHLGSYRLTGVAPQPPARSIAKASEPPRADDGGARLRAQYGIEVTRRPRLTGEAISLPKVRFLEGEGPAHAA